MDIDSGAQKPSTERHHHDQQKEDMKTKVNSASAPTPTQVAEKGYLADHKDVAMSLGTCFDLVIQDVTKSTALRIQHAVAKKEFEKKDEEYRKSKPTHEKFPQVEETLRRSRERAEQSLKLINEKFQSQDAISKEISIKCTKTLTSAFIDAANSQHVSCSRRNDELEETCRQLKSQVQHMEGLIEEQKKSHQEDIHRLQEAASRSEQDIKTMKDDLQALRHITTGLPQDLKQKLDKVSDLSRHFENHSSLESQLVKVKEDAFKNNMAIELCSKFVKGCRSQIPVLDVSDNTIEKSGESNKDLAILQNKVTALEEKINSLSSSSRASNVDSSIQPLQSNFHYVTASQETVSSHVHKLSEEIKNQKHVSVSDETGIASRLSSVETRLGVLECPPDSTTDSPQRFVTTFDINGIVKNVKDDLLELYNLTEEVKDKNFAKLVTDLQNKNTELEKRCSSGEAALSRLGNHFKTPQWSHDPQSAEFENVSISLPSISMGKTFEIIRSQPNLLPHMTEEQLNNKLHDLKNEINGVTNSMRSRIEGNEFSIANIDKRLSNINTKDLAQHILGQLDSVYPFVRNCQDTLATHESSLRATLSQSNKLIISMNELTRRTDLLETRFQDLSNETSKAVKEKTDEVARNAAGHQTIALETKARNDKFQLDMKKYQEEIGSELGILFTGLQDVQRFLRYGTACESREPSTPAIMSPSTSMFAAKSSNQAPIARSPSPSSTHSVISNTPGTLLTIQRTAPIQSDFNHKKRKLNGSTTLIDTNEVNTINGTTTGKKKRRGTGRYDSEDEDFEPTQPRISHSDNDD